VALFAILAQPFVPVASAAILDAMGVPEGNRMWPLASDDTILNALPSGLAITAPELLFTKIEDTDVAAWTAMFGGGG
jgi:methionyl-tRNA synthetase